MITGHHSTRQKRDKMKKKNIPETTVYRQIGKVGLLEYKALNKFDRIMNAFSTREGGVSEGQFATMNFSVTMGDEPGKVAENFRIFGEAIGIKPEDMVYADQKHTDHVMVVGPEHKGMGVTRERDFTHAIGYDGVESRGGTGQETGNVASPSGTGQETGNVASPSGTGQEIGNVGTPGNRTCKGFENGVDGLVTNEPGICLVTSYADCVPLYFVDPVHRAIGLTHSGWRGTVAKIGTRTLELMHEMYGSEPADMVCAIGPCICKKCYEVSEDVAEAFEAAYTKEQYERICEPRKLSDLSREAKEGLERSSSRSDRDESRISKAGKYLLDLAQANYEQFVEMGVKPENIALPDLCTACNHDFLHSHRATGGKRGGNCAFLMIK